MKEAEEEEEESSEEEEELSPEEQGKHRYLTFYASTFTCTSPFIYQLSVERFALNRMTSHHSFNIEQRAQSEGCTSLSKVNDCLLVMVFGPTFTLLVCLYPPLMHCVLCSCDGD